MSAVDKKEEQTNKYLDIKTYFNTSKDAVDSKKFNIYIGVSLGNKYFSEDNLKQYILWALASTKEYVSILIPDKIHAINYEVRNDYKHEKAMRAALSKGMKTKTIVQKCIDELTEDEKKLISVITWEDIETQTEYTRIRKELYKEFDTNPSFRQRMINIVRNNVSLSGITFELSDYEKLCQYPLDELPVLVNGFTFKGFRFNLIPYPGISEIDHLTVDIQEGVIYPGLTKRINPDNKVALLEAYAII